MQNPSSTQMPMTPTAGRAKPKSPSHARVTLPRPTAEDLVRGRGRRPPTPGDPGCDERHDLGEEKHRACNGAARPVMTALHHRRDDQPKDDRDRGEVDDQFKRVSQDAYERWVGKHSPVVRESDPSSPEGDPVPVVERVAEAVDERPEDEHAIRGECR